MRNSRCDLLSNSLPIPMPGSRIATGASKMICWQRIPNKCLILKLCGRINKGSLLKSCGLALDNRVIYLILELCLLLHQLYLKR